MTKDWNSVREEIVQLISNGASLEQVRALLSKERRFDASVRSYRKKLKQWKLTRVGQFEVLRASAAGTSNATGSIHNTTGPADSDMASVTHSLSELGENTPSRSGSTAGLSVHPDQQNPGRLSDAHALSPFGEYPSPSARTTSNPCNPQSLASTQLENTFRSLEKAENGPTMFDILERIHTQFKGGTNTILHFAASQDNFWVLDCILDFMLSRVMDVDITNANGMTALEVAIVNTQRENVQSLLRASADLTRRNPDSGQPLHRAASSTMSADICRVLLNHGAEVNALQHEKGSHQPTPLRLAIDRALSINRGQDKDQIAAMIEVLLEYGGNLSGGSNAYNHDSDILTFLDTWTRWQVPREGDSNNRGFYLGHYFRADCSPLCWFPARHCAECHSMASYIFSHTKRELAHLLIKSSDMDKFGAQLAQRILSPCTKRSITEADYLPSLLKKLLQKSDGLDQSSSWGANLIHQVLEDSPDAEKAALLDILIDSHVAMNHDRQRTFVALAKLKDDLRPQLAEICLDPGVGIVKKEVYENVMKHYLSIWDTSPTSDHSIKQMHSVFVEDLMGELEIQNDWISREESEIITQCMVHVLTKFLLTDTSSTAIPDRERIEALRLREIFNLAELSVSSKFLIGLWPFDERIAPSWHRAPGESDRRRDFPTTYPTSFSNSRSIAAKEARVREKAFQTIPAKRDPGDDLHIDGLHDAT